jgi:protein-tyrosine phosphatase
MHFTMDNIGQVLASPTDYAIAHRNWLLVELSDLLVPKAAGSVLARLIDAGLRPIVAHPERNPLLRFRLAELESWVALGCRLQLTAQSLVGRFGSRAAKTAESLIERGLAHFVASDAHDCRRRPPTLDSARRVLERRFGTAVAERLLVTNPGAVLAGDPVPPGEPCPRRRWFQRGWAALSRPGRDIPAPER